MKLQYMWVWQKFHCGIALVTCSFRPTCYIEVTCSIDISLQLLVHVMASLENTISEIKKLFIYVHELHEMHVHRLRQYTLYVQPPKINA